MEFCFAYSPCILICPVWTTWVIRSKWAHFISRHAQPSVGPLPQDLGQDTLTWMKVPSTKPCYITPELARLLCFINISFVENMLGQWSQRQLHVLCTCEAQRLRRKQVSDGGCEVSGREPRGRQVVLCEDPHRLSSQRPVGRSWHPETAGAGREKKTD
jgi:hypothetical protein